MVGTGVLDCPDLGIIGTVGDACPYDVATGSPLGEFCRQAAGDKPPPYAVFNHTYSYSAETRYPGCVR